MLRFRQLEAVAPSHSAFSVSGKSSEHLIEIASHVVAHRYHCAVHEGYAAAFSECCHVQEEHHLEEHTAFKFNESIVGYRIREVLCVMNLDAVYVVVLEIAVRTEVEDNQDCHYLAVGELSVAMPSRLAFISQKRLIFYLSIKFLAKFMAKAMTPIKR